MPEVQQILPVFEAPVLKPGPVFFVMEIEGKPPHKARHRSRIVIPREKWRKPFVHNYPDPDTEKHERMIAEYARLLMRGKPPTIEPVALLVHAFMPIPESWSKKDKVAAAFGALLPTSKPDADNFLKIADALNGIVWKDDSQVADGRCIKRYSEQPALRIEVREFLIDGLVKE